MVTKKLKITKPTHPWKGLMFALAVIPLGVLAWLFLWQYGFIASVVAWGIASGAIWLYQYGSEVEVTRTTMPWLLSIIFLGILAAFLSGIISDLWSGYTTDLGGEQGFLSGEFWTLVWYNITYPDFISHYVPDLLISLAFAALGAGGIVYEIFKETPAKKASLQQ